MHRTELHLASAHATLRRAAEDLRSAHAIADTDSRPAMQRAAQHLDNARKEISDAQRRREPSQ